MVRRNQPYAEMIAPPDGVEDVVEWGEVGRTCGYTGRGDLAGYCGGRFPSMVRPPDGSRVLTPTGRERARRRVL